MDAARPARASTRRLRLLRAPAAAAVLLVPGAAALAAITVRKQSSTTIVLAAGKTRTVVVPYPDALEYANATYGGRTIVLGPAAGATGSEPSRSLVSVVSAGSVLGGSEYRVRVHNGNKAGTAAERVKVVATTVEALPHR